jgi:Phage integrase, N-terminal SAM-like domain
MASIGPKRADGRYRARYRDASGREHAKHFHRKVDAQRWLRDETSKVDRGEWTDPKRAKVTLGELANLWLARQHHLKPSTRQRYASIVALHIVPALGSLRVGAADYDQCADWVSRLTASGPSGSSVRQGHRVLSLVLSDAVKARRIPSNPAEGVPLPKRRNPRSGS